MSPALGLLWEASGRGALVVAVAACTALACRRRSAELRHAIWLACVWGLLLLPAARLALPPWPLALLPPDVVQTADSGAAPSSGAARKVGGDGPSPGQRARTPSAGDLLVFVWLAGVGFFLTRAVVSHRQLGRLVRGGRPLENAGIEAELRRTASEVGVRTPACVLSDRISVPLAGGLTRPVVLLPTHSKGWSAGHLRPVLLHELSHLRRADPWWLALLQGVRALYWFHPLVWLAASQLRRESERACDDAVLRAGERPSRYAQTLLAVASDAAGRVPAAGVAFLRPRGVESRIAAVLSTGVGRRQLVRWEAMTVVVLALFATLLVGLARPVPATARDDRTPPALHDTGLDSRWRDRASEVRPSPARFKNVEACPVEILAATVRIVRRAEGDRDGVVQPNLRLANRDRDRRVRAVRLALDLPTTRDRMWEDVRVGPQGTASLSVGAAYWSAVVPAGDGERLSARIVGVAFDDGSSWGTEDPGPPAPGSAERRAPKPDRARAPKGSATTPAPEVRTGPPPSAPADGATTKAFFRNPPDAPVVIVSALTPLAPTPDEGRPTTWLPRVRVENGGARRVVALRVRYKADPGSHAVSGFTVSIEPGESAVLRKDDFTVWGRADAMTVQLLGARFDDGSVWGTMDSTIDARDAWVYPLEPEAPR